MQRKRRTKGSVIINDYAHLLEYTTLHQMLSTAYEYMDQLGELKSNSETLVYENISYQHRAILNANRVIYQTRQSKLLQLITSLRSETLLMLDQMVKQVKAKLDDETQLLDKGVWYNGEPDVCKAFQNIFDSSLTSELTFRKVCSHLVKTLLIWNQQSGCIEVDADMLPRDTSRLITDEFYIRVELCCYGKAMLDPDIMVKHSDSCLRIHRAVFRNNLPLIRRIAVSQTDEYFYADVNEIDPIGHTPLVLAIKLGRIDAIKVICDHYADPKLRPFDSFPNAMDLAVAMKSDLLVGMFISTGNKIKQYHLELQKKVLFKMLEEIRDFKIDMKFDCGSSIMPFVSSVAPSDTYKIYKKGSSIRLDMTLLGYNTMQCQRGDMSILFKGRGTMNEGEIFFIDHHQQSVSPIFTEASLPKIEQVCEKVGKRKEKTKETYTESATTDPSTDWMGGYVTKEIDGFDAQKYNVKCLFKVVQTLKVKPTKAQEKEESKLMEQDPTWDDYMDLINSNTFKVAKVAHIYKDQSCFLTQDDHIYSTSQIMMTGQGDERSSNRVPTLGSQTERPGNSLRRFMSKSTKTETTKKVNANVWLTNEHPFTLTEFIPMLQVLSFASKQIDKFKIFLEKIELPDGTFPLKAQIPLKLSLKANITLDNFSKCTEKKDFFMVDEQYYKAMVTDQAPQSPSGSFLKEIYNMVQLDEEQKGDGEEGEDNESIEQVKNMYQQMIRNNSQNSQMEDLLLDKNPLNGTSLVSEVDSRDINEMNESVGLGSYTFLAIKTMNDVQNNCQSDQSRSFIIKTKDSISLGGTHHDRDQLPFPLAKKHSITTYRKIDKNSENIPQTKNPHVPRINLSIPMKRHQFTIDQNQEMHTKKLFSGLNARGQFKKRIKKRSDKTLSKDFQPKKLKNFKNFSKYTQSQDKDSKVFKSANTNASTSGSTLSHFNNFSSAGTSRFQARKGLGLFKFGGQRMNTIESDIYDTQHQNVSNISAISLHQESAHKLNMFGQHDTFRGGRNQPIKATYDTHRHKPQFKSSIPYIQAQPAEATLEVSKPAKKELNTTGKRYSGNKDDYGSSGFNSLNTSFDNGKRRSQVHEGSSSKILFQFKTARSKGEDMNKPKTRSQIQQAYQQPVKEIFKERKPSQSASYRQRDSSRRRLIKRKKRNNIKAQDIDVGIGPN